jgi:uncharacterized protein
MTRPIGAPCWMDLLTSDAAGAREFYGGLFGWTAGDAADEFGGYFMFFADNEPVAGCMPKMPGVPSMEGPDSWGVYLSTADTKSTIDKAVAHGGRLREGPMDIADLGIEGVFTDGNGARIGVWQAKSFPGIGAFGPVGTPSYFELITRHYAESVAFYTDVCGWQPEVAGDTDEFRLSVLKDSDGETIAGITDGAGFMPPDVDDQWQFYVRVADTDVALAKVTELGGTVFQPGIDTPYGRLAAAADPTGAPFKLVG